MDFPAHLETLEASRDIGCSASVCVDCGVSMDIQGDQYTCPQCGRIGGYSESHIVDTGAMKSQGATGYRYQSDPLGNQQTQMYEMLISLRERYLSKLAAQQGQTYEARSAIADDSKNPLCALAPSTDIFMQVACQYCEIIRKSQDNGGKFKKRKNVRKEILAVLMLRACEKGTPFAKSKIAEMLGLGTDGFSRGYEILRMLEAEGIASGEGNDMYTTKLKFYYARTLESYFNSENKPQSQQLSRICYWFARRIVYYSLRNQIGYRSQIQSKVVGAIWFAICALHLPITCRQFEEMVCCDTAGGIKKTTFLRFASEIKRNAGLMRIALHYFPFLCNRDLNYLP